MITYTTRETARILDVVPGRVHAFVRAGIVEPQRDGNENRFTFRDLLVMRTALELERSDLSRRRVNAALRALQDRVSDDRPLTSLRIQAQDGEVVIDDERARWQLSSGQTLFDFDRSSDVAHLIPLDGVGFPQQGRDADEWFELGCSLEATSPRMARELYRRALELAPDHVDARINLGRLHHEDGELKEARRHYERALETSPEEPTAAYNLGVVLEDLGLLDEAIHAYLRAIAFDHGMADAYYNLARLYEQAGDRAAAIRHLKNYNDLVHGI